MPESLILPAPAGQYHQALVNDVLVRDFLFRYNIPHAVQVKRLIQILMNSMSRLIQVCWELKPTREQEIRALTDAMEELECSEAQIVTAWEEEVIVVDEKTITVLPAYTWLLQHSDGHGQAGIIYQAGWATDVGMVIVASGWSWSRETGKSGEALP